MAKFKLEGTEVEVEVRDEDAWSYQGVGWIRIDEPESDVEAPEDKPLEAEAKTPATKRATKSED